MKQRSGCYFQYFPLLAKKERVKREATVRLLQ
jgi:hypothetical protein